VNYVTGKGVVVYSEGFVVEQTATANETRCFDTVADIIILSLIAFADINN
jgi:hypothetical protein